MEKDTVNLIVASGRNGAIGRKGELIWHISDDLKRFKSLTTGYPVIMGRKTWESLPKKPLPGRRNIVVTSNPDYVAEGAEVVNEPVQALNITYGESPFIIGGGEIYRTLMPFATRLHLTYVDEDAPDADTRLDIDSSEWELTHKEGPFMTDSGLNYSFLTYERKA